MAANGLDTLAHAADAGAFALQNMLTIVVDDEAALSRFGYEAKTATGGAGMANDVGDGFAQSEGESVIVRRVSMPSRSHPSMIWINGK